MAVLGTLVAGAIGAFGKKVDVTELPGISPAETQRQTAIGNLGALPEAERLASAVNSARRREGRAALEAAAPGASNILASGTQTIAQMLKGQIPEDVAMEIQNRSAAQAFGGGYAGSGMSGNLAARDLGLTSLDLTQRGLSMAESWLSGAVQLTQPGGFFDVSSMMFSPQERLAFSERDREMRFGRDLLAAQVAAAPSPFQAAMGTAIMKEEEQIMEMAGSMASMAAVACWVARAAFGVEDLRWRLFRIWLLRDAPKWFRALYLRHGPAFAKVVEKSRTLQSIIRWLMMPAIRKVAYALAR